MIKQFTCQFERPISVYQADELNKKIWYLSEELKEYSLQYKEDYCIGINFKIEENEYVSFTKYLRNILENDIYGLKNIITKVLWSHPLTKDISENLTMNLLLKSKLVYEHGEGQISIKYPLTELFEFFDVIFKNIAIQLFDAEQFIFPTLIKSKVLSDAGYFESFPNLWNFVSRLHNDYSTFNKFKTDSFDLRSIGDLAFTTGYSLPPTMCYYVYDMLRDSIISNKAVTTRGKSFRYESKYCKTMSRLWDFTIREIVFLGTKEYVNQSLEKYRLVIVSLMDMLGFAGECMYANDPFYLTNNAALRVNIQKMNRSKVELRLNVSNKDKVAIASFNRHNQFISKSFNLYANDMHEFAYTACIGFGLERLVFAFLCQYGVDEKNWPKLIRNNYKKNNKEKIALKIFSKYKMCQKFTR